MNVFDNFRFMLAKASDDEWTNANPVILEGEKILVVMSDGTIREKIGNGIDKYNDLKFFGSDYNPNIYTGVLLAANWINNGTGSYAQQTITINGLKENYEIYPDVDCQLTGEDAEGDAAVLQGWEKVHICDTQENSLLVKCINNEDIPEVNIPIIIRTFD